MILCLMYCYLSFFCQNSFLPSVGYKLDEMATQYITRWFKYSLVGLLSWCPTDSAIQSELKSIIIVLAHIKDQDTWTKN